jgi:hypothetical protein
MDILIGYLHGTSSIPEPFSSQKGAFLEDSRSTWALLRSFFPVGVRRVQGPLALLRRSFAPGGTRVCPPGENGLILSSVGPDCVRKHPILNE